MRETLKHDFRAGDQQASSGRQSRSDSTDLTASSDETGSGDARLTRLMRELAKERKVKDGLERFRDTATKGNKQVLEQTQSMLEDSEAKILLLKMQIAKIEQQQYQQLCVFARICGTFIWLQQPTSPVVPHTHRRTYTRPRRPHTPTAAHARRRWHTRKRALTRYSIVFAKRRLLLTAPRT
jgi:hypothetical protein